MAKRRALGAQLQVGDGESPEVFTTIAHLTNFDAPDDDTDEIDATDHDSTGGYKENLPGFKDGGTVPLEGYYNPEHPTHAGPNGLAALKQSGAVRNFQIIIPGGGDHKIAFAGWIKKFKPTFPHDGMMGLTGELRVTGPTTYPTLEPAPDPET